MTNRTGRSIREAVQANFGRGCEVPRCHRPRLGASHYCRAHSRARARWGHPQGSRLLRRYYERERRDVTLFLREHEEHPGIQAALAWIGGWLRASSLRDLDQPGQLHAARLDAHGVTPLAILTECGAVWLYSTRNPRTLPDDARLTFAMASTSSPNGLHRMTSRRVSRARSTTVRYATSTHAVRTAVGDHLRRTLALLLYRIAETIAARSEQMAAMRDAFAAPFHQPTNESTAS